MNSQSQKTQLQEGLIQAHNSHWSTQQGYLTLQTIQDKSLLKKKICILMDRIFDGLQTSQQDFLSSILCTEDNEEYSTNTIKGVRFSFQTLQFELGDSQMYIIILIQKSRQDEGQTRNLQETKCRSNRQLITLCRFLQIIDLIVDGLETGRYRSKREVYYLYQDLFDIQFTLDRILKRLAFVLQVPRRTLQFVSATKGLCSGALLLSNSVSQQNLDLGLFSQSGKGLNISEFMDQWDQIQVYGDFILVVEKETMYFRILDEAQIDFLSKLFSQNYQDRCVIITGKGYPCLSTQSFIKLIAQQNPNKSLYYLGDLDPHGIDILCQYTFGNPDSMFERNNVPWIRWLGSSIDIPNTTQGIPMTSREKVVLQKILQKEFFNPPPILSQLEQSTYVYLQLWIDWRDYINNLLMKGGYKYELEAIVPEGQMLSELCQKAIDKFEISFEQKFVKYQ